MYLHLINLYIEQISLLMFHWSQLIMLLFVLFINNSVLLYCERWQHIIIYGWLDLAVSQNYLSLPMCVCVCLMHGRNLCLAIRIELITINSIFIRQFMHVLCFASHPWNRSIKNAYRNLALNPGPYQGDA